MSVLRVVPPALMRLAVTFFFVLAADRIALAEPAEPAAIEDPAAWKPGQELRVPVHDLRQEREQIGRMASLNASHKAVVLKIHGDGEAVFENAEGTMKALRRFGYARIGIVRASGDSKVMEVYSGGFRYGVINNVDDGPTTSQDIHELVTGAYDLDIRPNLEKIIKAEAERRRQEN